MTPWDQVKVDIPTVVCGAGAGPSKRDEPSGVELLRLVRTSLLRRTAPSTFNSPAPCSNMLKFGSCWAEYIINVLTRLGEREGLASNIKAAAPAAKGAAIEVPLNVICFRVEILLTPASSKGLCASR